jgi:hypothetical protein
MTNYAIHRRPMRPLPPSPKYSRSQSTRTLRQRGLVWLFPGRRENPLYVSRLRSPSHDSAISTPTCEFGSNVIAWRNSFLNHEHTHTIAADHGGVWEAGDYWLWGFLSHILELPAIRNQLLTGLADHQCSMVSGKDICLLVAVS